MTELNLKLLRNSRVEKRWKFLSKRIFPYQDMDIINVTLSNYIKPISSKFCVIPKYIKKGYYEGTLKTIIPKSYADDINNDPVIFHFAGKKPWNDVNVTGADIWWNFIHKNTALKSLFHDLI